MPAKDEVVEVQGTVKTKQETERGVRFELDIPAFKSKYPTIVTVPEDEEIAQQLKPGRTYSLALIRENAKEGKADDSPRMYDFYWGIFDAGGGAAPAPAPGPAPAAAPAGPAAAPASAAAPRAAGAPQPAARAASGAPAASPGRTDATGISIERQKALDLAGRDFAAYLEAHAHDVERVPGTAREYGVRVTSLAAAYAHFLATGAPMKAAEVTEQAPQPQTEEEEPLFPPQ